MLEKSVEFLYNNKCYRLTTTDNESTLERE